MLDYSPALMTDMYEYTMLDACLKDGTANVTVSCGMFSASQKITVKLIPVQF